MVASGAPESLQLRCCFMLIQLQERGKSSQGGIYPLPLPTCSFLIWHLVSYRNLLDNEHLNVVYYYYFLNDTLVKYISMRHHTTYLYSVVTSHTHSMRSVLYPWHCDVSFPDLFVKEVLGNKCGLIYTCLGWGWGGISNQIAQFIN